MWFTIYIKNIKLDWGPKLCIRYEDASLVDQWNLDLSIKKKINNCAKRQVTEQLKSRMRCEDAILQGQWILDLSVKKKHNNCRKRQLIGSRNYEINIAGPVDVGLVSPQENTTKNSYF